jgi:predicted metal-dependent hydrolase
VARPHLSREVTELSTVTGLRPNSLQVRLQQTRWGSCSPRGTISLNAAVLLRSPEELRYVVIHELCHLRHMNHSRRFWSLVERFEPDYRRLDRRLDAAWDSMPLWLCK